MVLATAAAAVGDVISTAASITVDVAKATAAVAVGVAVAPVLVTAAVTVGVLDLLFGPEAKPPQHAPDEIRRQAEERAQERAEEAERERAEAQRLADEAKQAKAEADYKAAEDRARAEEAERRAKQIAEEARKAKAAADKKAAEDRARAEEADRRARQLAKEAQKAKEAADKKAAEERARAAKAEADAVKAKAEAAKAKADAEAKAAEERARAAKAAAEAVKAKADADALVAKAKAQAKEDKARRQAAEAKIAAEESRKAQEEAERKRKEEIRFARKPWQNEKAFIDGPNACIVAPSRTGKSSLCNALNGLKDGDIKAAKTSANEECTTVQQPFVYMTPGMPANLRGVTMWDLPGCGTQRFPVATYIADFGLRYFDLAIIVGEGGMKEIDLEIMDECKKYNIPVIYVRTKVDIGLDNHLAKIFKFKQRAVWKEEDDDEEGDTWSSREQPPKLVAEINNYVATVRETVEKKLPGHECFMISAKEGYSQRDVFDLKELQRAIVRKIIESKFGEDEAAALMAQFERELRQRQAAPTSAKNPANQLEMIPEGGRVDSDDDSGDSDDSDDEHEPS